MDYKGQVALITGGTRGIGAAIAEALALQGVNVIVAARNSEEARQKAAKLSGHGIRTLGVKLDVSKSEEVMEVFGKIRTEFQRMDILVNNAGITKDGLLLRMKEEAWDTVIDINLKGVFLCTREALKDMVSQKYGRIVSVTSVAAFMGNPGQANYGASKAGIVGFTKTVAKEYANRGITANAVAPGFIETAMTDVLRESMKEEVKKLIPVGRFGTVEDVARAVVFLASPQAEYITGQVIHVNGGLYM